MTITNQRTKHTSLLSGILCLLVIAGALGMQAARLAGFRSLVMPLILLASTSFVGLGISSGATRSTVGRLTLCGLACCWIGDVVGPGNFLLGLMAFLVGHLFFAASFAIHGIAPSKGVVAVFVVFALSLGTAGMLWPHLPRSERIQFAAYCTVISIMLVAAAGARPGLPLALPAASLFYISDVCVARWRYLDSPVDGYICYLLYYTACAMFALNTGYARKAPDRH